MCGRYSIGVSPEELEEVFEAPISGQIALPRWNVAPTQDAPVVVVDQSGERGTRALRWGLVPRWAEDSGGARWINARAESVSSKPAFREAFECRRCLIPADGFYEWVQRGARKQPYWIHHCQGGLLGFAGLWERWQPRADEALETFTILTTTPNALVAPLHDRMPVVLEPEAWTAWLDRATPARRGACAACSRTRGPARSAGSIRSGEPCRSRRPPLCRAAQGGIAGTPRSLRGRID